MYDTFTSWRKGWSETHGGDTLPLDITQNDSSITINRAYAANFGFITKNGFTVRVVANKKMLIFIFNTYRYDVSHFQLEVIHKLIDLIRTTYDNEDIKYPYINFVTGRDRFVFNEYKDIDEQLDKLEHLLDKRMDESNKKDYII